MADIKDSGFKSYIDNCGLELITLKDSQRTKLLTGETKICEVENVLLYRPLSAKKKYLNGILTITTFKLSFATADDILEAKSCLQQNHLLDLNDVCLSSIDIIYQIGDKSKKKLLPGQSISSKIKELLIVCKNMRTFEFSFKNSSKDAGKNIANALLHHSYPKRHSLLFAYEYKEPQVVKSGVTKEARYFRSKEDWRLEFCRTKSKNWRISDANQNFRTSPMLMQPLIVPQSLTDSALTQAVEHFRNRFGPVWVWGTATGAALVRMADLLPTITDRVQENTLLEHIRRSHPEKRQPHVFDLSRECPSFKDVAQAYIKLRDLCIPCSQFNQKDFKFYGLLDQSRWLHYVGTCLRAANETANKLIDENCTVVLQEGNGSDLNCVISSLTQIILDPHYRSKYGFQSLIQKEWVMAGHPFAMRLNLVRSDAEFSPIFLLFLDCVWQLIRQYPTAFNFSETYLTSLWDSTFLTIFDTFLFDCEHDRYVAETGQEQLPLRPVWDWSQQFSEKDVALFCNPLFEDAFTERLRPLHGLSSLEIWQQCYFRWLPDLEIVHGGPPQIDLGARLIVAEIWALKESADGKANGKHEKNKEEYLRLGQNVNGFFPFGRTGTTVSYPLLQDTDQEDDAQSLIINLAQ